MLRLRSDSFGRLPGGVAGADEPHDEAACLERAGAMFPVTFDVSRGIKSVSYFGSSGNQNASVFSLVDPIVHVTSVHLAYLSTWK